MDGKTPKLKDYEDAFMNYLIVVQEKYVGLIPKDLEVRDAYGIQRSGRRGANTHARNRGVAQPDIDLCMFWMRNELNMGRCVSAPTML